MEFAEGLGVKGVRKQGVTSDFHALGPSTWKKRDRGQHGDTEAGTGGGEARMEDEMPRS